MFGSIGKWDFGEVTSSFACIFITIGIYPIIHSLIITILLGLVLYLPIMKRIRKNENHTASKQKNEAIQTEIEKLKNDIQK